MATHYNEENASNAQQAQQNSQAGGENAAQPNQEQAAPPEPMTVEHVTEVLDLFQNIQNPFAKEADLLTRRQPAQAPYIQALWHHLNTAFSGIVDGVPPSPTSVPVPATEYANGHENGPDSTNGVPIPGAGDATNGNMDKGDMDMRNLLAILYDFNARLRHIERQNEQLGKYLRHWDEAWVEQIADLDKLRVKFKATATHSVTYDERLTNLEQQAVQQQTRMARAEAKMAENSTAVIWMQGALLQVTENITTISGRVQDMAVKLRNALDNMGVGGDH